ncbi:MAG: IS256 family transposase, partial [Nitrospirae bacterium]|nr:IS256 family transposase [Nitrospirota bacterium]
MEEQKRSQTTLQDFNFSEFQEQAIKELKNGKSLSGKNGVLTPLIKRILEAALQGEIESH